MDWRENLGGMAEDAINKAIDDNLKDFSTDKIKEELHKQVDKLVDEYVGGKIDGLAQKLKANIIDKLDGVDDIQDV